MKSIIQKDKCCYICGTVIGLHNHHIFFGTANRKLSEKDGLKVYLCWEHHEGTFGVHGREGNNLNLKLKKLAERKWIEYYKKTEKDFIDRYGESILWK